jgi:hypothetical protein
LTVGAFHLELRRRERADEPRHALVGAVGPAQGEEHEQVPERDGDDEDRHEPPERLAFETEDVLDRSDEVREQGDRAEADGDRGDQQRRYPAATARAAEPRQRDRDEHDCEQQADDPEEARHVIAPR